MKTIEELYKEVQADEMLKKEFIVFSRIGQTEAFLKAHNCDATVADVMAFLNGVQEEALSDDDMEMVAGGGACSSMACESYGCSCMSRC